tara:strand:- start:286 stop:558 length:273 start_codon:yes stop_codon:yes gene_type:complete
MMDHDCAVCCSLLAARESLEEVVGYIMMSCAGQKRKEDFGLTKSFINEQINVIKKMEKYHQYYHSTGESLIETNRQLNSNTKPPRWHKPK